MENLEGRYDREIAHPLRSQALAARSLPATEISCLPAPFFLDIGSANGGGRQQATCVDGR